MLLYLYCSWLALYNKENGAYRPAVVFAAVANFSKWGQDAIGGGRLRPRCLHVAILAKPTGTAIWRTWTKHTRRLLLYGTWRRPQNWKITHHIAVRGGGGVFWDNVSGQTYRHADHNTWHPCRPARSNEIFSKPAVGYIA